MADLDAELLALAGGDSSDDEGSNIATATTKAASPPKTTITPHAANLDSSANKTTVGSKPTNKANGATGKNMKKSKMNDSEEEGEA